MDNDVKIRKHNALYTLIGANWNLNLIELKESEDVLEIFSEDKVLMAYYYKGDIEVSLGENAGTIAYPDIFPIEVWSLNKSAVRNKSSEEVIKVFQCYFDNFDIGNND